MGDAPERIWVEASIAIIGDHGSTAWAEKEDEDEIEYVRADHIEALEDRVRVLEGALQEAHDDLFMRATKDSQGYKVVDVGASCWLRICAALQGDKE